MLTSTLIIHFCGIFGKASLEFLLPGVDKKQQEKDYSVFTLNNQGNLNDEETMSELKEFIKPMDLDGLLFDESAPFNWVKLQRLISMLEFGRSKYSI